MLFEKGGEARGVFCINGDDVFPENARMLDRANADEWRLCVRVAFGRVYCATIPAIEIGSAKELVEVPEQRITGNAV